MIFPIFEASYILALGVLKDHGSSFFSNSLLKQAFVLEEVIFDASFDHDPILPLSFIGGIGNFRRILALSLGDPSPKLPVIDAILLNKYSLDVRQDDIISSDKDDSLIYHTFLNDANVVPLLEVDKISISVQLPLLLELILLDVFIVYRLRHRLKGISELGGHGHQDNVEGHFEDLSVKLVFLKLM